MIASDVLLKSMVRHWHGYNRLMEGLAVYYWPRVIGPAFSRKTMAEKVMAGTLWVRTEEPTIAHQLSFFIPRILKGYRELIGDGVIKNVRFTVGNIKTSISLENGSEEVYIGDEKVSIPDSIMDAANVINDEKLKQSFIKLARGSYQRRTHLEERGWTSCSCGVLKDHEGLCADCLRKEREEKKEALTFLISKYPQLTFDEAQKKIPDIQKEDWDKVRQRLVQIAEDQVVLLAKEIRRAKDRNRVPVIVGACQRFLALGGEKKALVYHVGSDLWGLIQGMLDKSSDEEGN